MTFEEWAATQGGNIDITNQFQYESYKAGQESMRPLVEKMSEAGITMLLGAKPSKTKSEIGADMSEIENWRIRRLADALQEASKFLGEK
jgi:phosphopantothenoylcysteine synthetase/decarboxylase